MTTLLKIKIAAVVIFVIIALGSITWYQGKKITELKQDIAAENKISQNNLLASQDSLRKEVGRFNNPEWEKLGFIYDLQSQSDKYLREALLEQGSKLAMIETMTIDIQSIVGTIQSKFDESDLEWYKYSFKYDTLFVNVDGVTKVNKKDKTLSFTSLSLAFKPISLSSKLSMNPQGQIVTDIEVTTPGIVIGSLDTKVDKSIYDKMNSCPEERFLDLLRIGAMLGTNSLKFTNGYKYVFGFKVEYKSVGLWSVTDGANPSLGFSFSVPVSTFIK